MVVKSGEETCQYMIERAKSCLSSGDPSYAKCWIMTANALFPHNDQIKFEAYNMCKCEGNVEEASKYFCEIFTSSSSDQLIEELKLIVNSCKSEWQTHGPLTTDSRASSLKNTVASSFYPRLLTSLSPDLQHELLKRVADKTENIMTLVDLMLFILRKFPSKISEHGMKLINIMLEAEKMNETNYISKKLVFDVLPIIFGATSDIIVEETIILNLVQKTLKFYVEQTIQTDISETSDRENSDVVEIKVNEIFKLIGNKLEWVLLNDDKTNSFELNYEKIINFIDQNCYTGDGSSSPIDLSSASTVKLNCDEQTNKQILYATILLFVKCLRRYVKLNHDMVLIEQIVATSADSKILTPVTKKRKVQFIEPEINASLELRQVFVVASNCLKLLIENSEIKKEFQRISESTGLDACLTFRSFIIDSNIYKCEYQEALTLLKKKTNDLKCNIQLICASFMLRDCNATLKYCLDAIENLVFIPTTNTDEQAKTNVCSMTSYRQLKFIHLCVDEVVRYVVEVIISCLKDRVILSLKPSDIGLGHLLVLSQFNWPQHVELFYGCMSLIKTPTKTHSPQSQPKFVYHNFMNYIFIPDIIEEFMSIIDEIILDLKPSSSSIGSSLKSTSKAITTRGINKGAKEEVKSALIAQMKNSKTTISSDLFIEFISKEIKIFLQNLTK